MKTFILAAVLGLLVVASATAETGQWHRFKEYDIGNPRPAGQPNPITVGR